MNRRSALRILDANFNRAREGLRVCEEVTRFAMNDTSITRQLKTQRHAVSSVLKSLPVLELVAARDTRRDVGKAASRLERSRSGASGLFTANIERVKEALRVLEEVVKVVRPIASGRLKRIRFAVYAIEKRALPKLEAVCDLRPAVARSGPAGRRS